MTNSEFTELFIKLGHNILHTNYGTWIILSNNYVHSFPTLAVINPNETDFSYIFSKTNAKCILFRTNNNILEPNTYEYIFEGNNYTLDMFDSKIRNQIKKGLKSCEIKKPSIESLINKGFSINKATLNKQKRTISYLDDKTKWTRYINILYDYKDVYIYGAYVQNDLAAYSVFFKVNNTYIIYHPFIDHSYSSSCPMNALLFTFINNILEKENRISISYGLASYISKEGLDKFKKGMLFYEKPATRITLINPKYNRIITPLLVPFIKFLNKYKVINNYIADNYLFLAQAKQQYQMYKKKKSYEIS